eukprot:Awhi_evm1s10754
MTSFSFVEESKYSCIICLCHPVDACQIPCCDGNYCYSCLSRWIKKSGRCCICRNSLQEKDVVADHHVRRKVFNLNAKCLSCQIEGPMAELQRSHKCFPNMKVIHAYDGLELGETVKVLSVLSKWIFCVKYEVQKHKTNLELKRLKDVKRKKSPAVGSMECYVQSSNLPKKKEVKTKKQGNFSSGAVAIGDSMKNGNDDKMVGSTKRDVRHHGEGQIVYCVPRKFLKLANSRDLNKNKEVVKLKSRGVYRVIPDLKYDMKDYEEILETKTDNLMLENHFKEIILKRLNFLSSSDNKEHQQMTRPTENCGCCDSYLQKCMDRFPRDPVILALVCLNIYRHINNEICADSYCSDKINILPNIQQSMKFFPGDRDVQIHCLQAIQKLLYSSNVQSRCAHMDVHLDIYSAIKKFPNDEVVQRIAIATLFLLLYSTNQTSSFLLTRLARNLIRNGLLVDVHNSMFEFFNSLPFQKICLRFLVALFQLCQSEDWKYVLKSNVHLNIQIVMDLFNQDRYIQKNGSEAIKGLWYSNDLDCQQALRDCGVVMEA